MARHLSTALVAKVDRSRSNAKQSIGTRVGMCGAEHVRMHASYLPQSGRCARYELVEKRHVKVEQKSRGNVLVRELVGVMVPKE